MFSRFFQTPLKEWTPKAQEESYLKPSFVENLTNENSIRETYAKLVFENS